MKRVSNMVYGNEDDMIYGDLDSASDDFINSSNSTIIDVIETTLLNGELHTGNFENAHIFIFLLF